jgi:hypothetical protein
MPTGASRCKTAFGFSNEPPNSHCASWKTMMKWS